MTGFLAFALLLLVTGTLAWGIGAVAAMVCLPFLGDDSGRPSARIRRCLMIAGLPWLLPVTVVLAVLLLAAAKPLGIITDHCLYHGPGHPHLCLGHLPVISPGMLLPIAILLLLAMLAVVVTRFFLAQRRMLATLQSMASLARGSGRLRILDDASSLAFAAATPRPMILMTTGLAEKLDRHQRRIVLGHEVAHLRNRDLAWNRLFEILLLLHLPRIGESLRRAWRQALEERADDAVAERFGGDAVAQTLLTLVRAAAAPAPAALSAAGGDTLGRIDRLLAPPPPSPRRTAFEFCYTTGLLILPVLIVSAHHALETLIGILLSV